MKKIRKRWIVLGSVVILLGILSIPEIRHVNSGISESVGSVREGKLKNGWLMPFDGPNFRYFSRFSYYILNNAYVHSTVFHVLTDAYAACESTCPGKKFVLMECARKRGGQMLIHWTHQNGTSVDFMVPKKRKDDSSVTSNKAGMFHYLLQFDPAGRLKLNKGTEIDFETMACHILAIDDAARKHDIGIHKILFNTDLHDELFSTPSGKELKAREIRIIPRLNDLVNQYHDDHYHIDFRL